MESEGVVDGYGDYHQKVSSVNRRKLGKGINSLTLENVIT